jgi:hypothetical protein
MPGTARSNAEKKMEYLHHRLSIIEHMHVAQTSVRFTAFNALLGLPVSLNKEPGSDSEIAVA